MDSKDILAYSTNIAHNKRLLLMDNEMLFLMDNEMLFLMDEHNTVVVFYIGDTGRLDYLMDQRST